MDRNFKFHVLMQHTYHIHTRRQSFQNYKDSSQAFEETSGSYFTGWQKLEDFSCCCYFYLLLPMNQQVAEHFAWYDCHSDISHTILMLILCCLTGWAINEHTTHNLFTLSLSSCLSCLKIMPDDIVRSKFSYKTHCVYDYHFLSIRLALTTHTKHLYMDAHLICWYPHNYWTTYIEVPTFLHFTSEFTSIICVIMVYWLESHNIYKN